jgi:urease accessory protein
MSIDARQLLILLNWMSPAFPVGTFAYSHGLEQAIADGSVKNADGLKGWIEDVITRGSGWNDAVLFAQCWERDAQELNDLALALPTSKERYFETTELGRAFEVASSLFLPSPPRMWGRGLGEGVAQRRNASKDLQAEGPPHPALSPPEAGARGSIENGGGSGEISYPIAAGVACNAAGIHKSYALLAFLQGFSNALISVGVRLIPLGQTRGLEVMRDLMPVIAATADRAGNASLEDLGSIAIASDIAAMKHETLTTRIFRT